MPTTYAVDVKAAPRSVQYPVGYFVPYADRPWGAPAAEGAAASPALTPQAAKRRRDAIAKLLPSLRTLTERLHEVLLDGGLAEHEYAQLHSLQVWIGQLVTEQEAPRGGQAPRTRKK